MEIAGLSGSVLDGNQHTRAEFGARRSEVTSELTIGVDEILAEDWPSFMAKVNKIAPVLGVTFSVPAFTPARFDQLRQELSSADADIKAGLRSVATRVQYQALVKSLVLTAQVDGGRLPPSLRAQALTERGIQYDFLGRFGEAAKDFALSMELAPDAADTWNAAAVNALQSADYPRAIALADHVLAKSPADSQARNTRALAHVYLKDYDAAKADFEELLKDSAQVRRGYPLVWLSILARRAGGDPTAALARYSDDQLPTDWPRSIVDWARGSASADALIAVGKTSSSRAERLCEAYYYIAERYLAEGDTRNAAKFFHLVVDQRVIEYVEDASARNRLAQLKQ